MMLCYPQMEEVIDFSERGIPTLVIENPAFYRALMMDLYAQKNGEEGEFILSENGKTLSISSSVELIDNCLQFNLNTKPLLNKIAVAMEQMAVNEEFFLKTADILQRLEQYIDELAFAFDCDIACERCTTAGVIKAMGITLRDEYKDPLERLVDYMELIREFERDKLFVLVNLRSFFDDPDVERFLKTAIDHGYHVLLMDSVERKKLPMERRLTVDIDLCEF